MKHPAQNGDPVLEQLLGEAGMCIAREHRHQLLEYLDRLIEMNRTLNLTRIADLESGIRLHLVDSLLALGEVADAPPGTLLDVGTGGGLPGVALCIAGGRKGVLLDSVGKKTRAVNGILVQMGLENQIVALNLRAEDHAVSAPGEYAVVTARAVAELPCLVELAAPLLGSGGRLVALKGAPDVTEIERGRAVARATGMREITIRHAQLPAGGERRCLIAYERCGEPTLRLPRRVGAAQNTPLA